MHVCKYWEASKTSVHSVPCLSSITSFIINHPPTSTLLSIYLHKDIYMRRPFLIKLPSLIESVIKCSIKALYDVVYGLLTQICSTILVEHSKNTLQHPILFEATKKPFCSVHYGLEKEDIKWEELM